MKLVQGRLGIEVSPRAKAAISQAALASQDGNETGGLLLGRDPENTGSIEVVRAAGPGPRATRKPGYFLRDLIYSQRLARLAYEREGLQWIGDWHTHPKGPAHPSTSDVAVYARHLSDRDLDFEAFVAIIVTPHEEHGWDECRLNKFVYQAR